MHRFDPSKMKNLFDPKRDVWLQPQELVKLLALKPGNFVGDYGCGPGYLAPFLSNAVGDDGILWAFDASIEMCEAIYFESKKQGVFNIAIKHVPEPDMIPMADATLDAIITLDVFHEIGDKPLFLAEAFRVLKPGGRLLIADWKDAPTPYGPPQGERFAKEKILDLVPASSFMLSAEPEILPMHYVILLVKPA